MRFELVAAVALTAIVGCGKSPQTFTTRMKVDRIIPFGDPPSVLDLELSYVDCPGDEGAIVRGDKEFAACAQKLTPGAETSAEITYAYNAERQQYRSDIVKVGDCVRKVDPKDDASHEMLRSCEAVKVHGIGMGVHCDKTRNPELVAKCPWFYRK